jgi:hypothetical protein
VPAMSAADALAGGTHGMSALEPITHKWSSAHVGAVVMLEPRRTWLVEIEDEKPPPEI